MVYLQWRHQLGYGYGGLDVNRYGYMRGSEIQQWGPHSVLSLCSPLSAGLGIAVRRGRASLAHCSLGSGGAVSAPAQAARDGGGRPVSPLLTYQPSSPTRSSPIPQPDKKLGKTRAPGTATLDSRRGEAVSQRAEHLSEKYTFLHLCNCISTFRGIQTKSHRIRA